MLAEQRYEAILKILDERQSVTLPELKALLHTSESTIRRDLTALHRMGKLVKVFGGAVSAEWNYSTEEPVVTDREQVHIEAKQKIGSYAATLVRPNSLVYLDAGTTTNCVIDHLTEASAIYVTNGIKHASRLSAQGFRVILIGGEIKQVTEAVIGHEALHQLQKYNFSMGFFGSNGITHREGFTTPDPREAAIKEEAMNRCQQRYVLCDSSKFGQITPVTFSPFGRATILTETSVEGFDDENILVVPESIG